MKKHERGRGGAKKRRGGSRRIYAFLGLAVAVFAGTMLYPSPYSARRGGVELFGENPEAEIYGPEAPAQIVGGYTVPVIQSVMVADKEGEEETIYVYAAEDQKNYHMPTCNFAYASAKRMTLYEAYYLGYTPGRCCDAPAYDGQ